MGVDVGMRNLALCVMNARTHQVVYMDVLDILLQCSVLVVADLAPREEKKLDKKRKKKHASVYELVSGVVATLKIVMETEPGLSGLVHIVIENQPHFKLPHMKNIAVAIHSFFQTIMPATRVQYMQATEKFAQLGISKAQLSQYRDRKKTAVAAMKECLDVHSDVPAATLLELYKKKDDLADAYLLALRGVALVV